MDFGARRSDLRPFYGLIHIRVRFKKSDLFRPLVNRIARAPIAAVTGLTGINR